MPAGAGTRSSVDRSRGGTHAATVPAGSFRGKGSTDPISDHRCFGSYALAYRLASTDPPAQAQPGADEHAYGSGEEEPGSPPR